MSDGYYILDARTVVGNCALWWGPNSNGYTTDLAQAGVYTREHAEALHRNRKSDIPVPVDAAKAASVMHVHVDGLWSDPAVADRMRAWRAVEAEAMLRQDELSPSTLEAALSISPFGDPFPEDTPPGFVLLRDWVVKAAKDHACRQCGGQIRKGLYHRCRVEKGDGSIHHFRWCHGCTRLHLGPPHDREEFDSR